MNDQSSTLTINDSGSSFRFGFDPGGSPLFNSDPLDNVHCKWHYCSKPNDHMVSWLTTDGEYAGDYVVAWEDLKNLSDRDYNDLVVCVSVVSGATVVPLPSSIMLLMSRIPGLASVVRQRSNSKCINHFEV